MKNLLLYILEAIYTMDKEEFKNINLILDFDTKRKMSAAKKL